MKPNILRLRTVFAIILFAVAFATLALAHNKLLKSEPAPNAILKTAPKHVMMWFAEKPDLTVSKLTLKSPSGAVEMGPVRASAENAIMADVKGKLSDGQYTVSWQTAGDDGHVSKGDFNFTVKGSQ